jgi:NADH-quinone oxidoreductase subunit L
MNSWITTNVWLIPAAPLVASILILAFGKAARRAAAVVAILGQIAALTMSIFAFVPTLHSHGFRAIQNFTWFTFGEQILRIGFVLDPLAAAMLMMIALVGLCIFVFSIGYMAEDKNFSRFFAYLSFTDWILDRAPERCGCGKKSVHHHAHWRHGIFSRYPVALSPQRDAAFL